MKRRSLWTRCFATNEHQLKLCLLEPFSDKLLLWQRSALSALVICGDSMHMTSDTFRSPMDVRASREREREREACGSPFAQRHPNKLGVCEAFRGKKGCQHIEQSFLFGRGPRWNCWKVEQMHCVTSSVQGRISSSWPHSCVSQPQSCIAPKRMPRPLASASVCLLRLLTRGCFEPLSYWSIGCSNTR